MYVARNNGVGVERGDIVGERADSHDSTRHLADLLPVGYTRTDSTRDLIEHTRYHGDTLVVTDSLLKGLNEELNSFLEQLLKEE